MKYLEFEFDTEKDLRETVNRLWDTLGVTGELSIRPMASGRWRLELTSEKELRDSQLEKLNPFRIQSGD